MKQKTETALSENRFRVETRDDSETHFIYYHTHLKCPLGVSRPYFKPMKYSCGFPVYFIRGMLRVCMGVGTATLTPYLH